MRFVAMVVGLSVLTYGVEPWWIRGPLAFAVALAAWREGEIEGRMLGRLLLEEGDG